jgi:hypothetical protein
MGVYQHPAVNYTPNMVLGSIDRQIIFETYDNLSFN